MKFTLSAKIEKTECGIAALLDLCEYKSGAYRMDRSGRDENTIARRYRPPHDKIRD